MKIFENVIIYKCDFCKKELKLKHAMANHESKCTKNPINFRPCLNGCKYLEQKEVSWEARTQNYMSGESNYNFGKAFYCAFHQKYILHPKVENEIGLKHIYNSEEEETEQEAMPKECESFDDGYNF